MHRHAILPNSHRTHSGGKGNWRIDYGRGGKGNRKIFHGVVSPVVELVARFAWAFNFGSIEIFIKFVIFKTA
jgi:hypothetical protein